MCSVQFSSVAQSCPTLRPHGLQDARLLLLLLSRFSRVRPCATPWTAAHQASPSPGFSRQEHWSGLHFLLQCMKVKSESEVAQSCRTPATPWTAAYQAPPSMGSSRQSTGVGCHNANILNRD